jgi:hypothetical protein
MEPALEKLRKAREARPYPLVDDKVLADWNGMMVAAMASRWRLFATSLRAGGEDGGRVPPRRAPERAGNSFTSGETGRRGSRRFSTTTPSSPEGFWYSTARAGGAGSTRRSASPKRWRGLRDRGALLPVRAEALPAGQSKPVHDGAIASGNGTAASVLLRLFELTGKATYRERAEDALRFASDLAQSPQGAMTLALAVGDTMKVPRRPSSRSPLRSWSPGSRRHLRAFRFLVVKGAGISTPPGFLSLLDTHRDPGRVRNVSTPRKSDDLRVLERPLGLRWRKLKSPSKPTARRRCDARLRR